MNCLEPFDWNGARAYRRNSPSAPWDEVDLPPPSDPRWGAAMQAAFIRCPNEENGVHYFPVEFALFEEPKVIGFVGDSSAGKTCLLAAIAGEIERNKLEPYGLQTEPANMAHHAAYVRELVNPFFQEGLPPPHTPFKRLVEFEDAILVRSGAGTFPVVFFDTAGDQLKDFESSHLAVRFLHRVDGLIFVADPTQTDDGTSRGDPTHMAAIASLRWAHGNGQDRFTIPAAVAITKSDLLRFEPPVDRWLSRPPARTGGVDPRLLIEESRDAYAFLHHRGATGWLMPMSRFDQCTLHFVSASGCAYDREANLFTRPARPRRVLEPLVALLATIGVLDGGLARGAYGY